MPSVRTQRTLAGTSLVLVLGGLLIGAGALLGGSQGTILSGLPAALAICFVGVVLAAVAWRHTPAKVALVLGILELLAGGAALVLILILASGFAGVK